MNGRLHPLAPDRDAVGRRADGQADDGTVAREVTVLIVDDQAPFRTVARTVVELAAGFTVAGEAATGEEAVRAAHELRPDVVLMDINLPGMTGIDATRQIVEVDARVRVVLLSTYTQSDLPADARTCGAIGYVHKEDFGPDVLTEISHTG